jgi:hypothetical protein
MEHEISSVAIKTQYKLLRISFKIVLPQFI